MRIFPLVLRLLVVLGAMAWGRAWAALQCPAVLPSAWAGFELIGKAPSRPAVLAGMELFDGPPGEETRASRAQLAPDGTDARPGGYVQSWVFAGDEKLLMVCRYRGSGAYYRAVVATLPKKCMLRKDFLRVVAGCG